jgi:hypothetical protein
MRSIYQLHFFFFKNEMKKNKIVDHLNDMCNQSIQKEVKKYSD